jgi:hypothetical protein
VVLQGCFYGFLTMGGPVDNIINRRFSALNWWRNGYLQISAKVASENSVAGGGLSSFSWANS